MFVDIAGEHRHVGIHLGQRAQATEVFMVQIGKDADAHGRSPVPDGLGFCAECR
ncbi:hypothetical protein D9M71_845110 [compost metagenome]